MGANKRHVVGVSHSNSLHALLTLFWIMIIEGGLERDNEMEFRSSQSASINCIIKGKR